MADFEVYAFPNVFLGMGVDNDFVRDLQRGLGLTPSGVFDFLTMCYVVVHKHRNGLNYEEPTVDRSTWDSIFGTDSSGLDVEKPDVQENFVQPIETESTNGAAAANPYTPVNDATKNEDATTTAAEQENNTGIPATTPTEPVEPAAEPAPAEPAPAEPTTGTDTADNEVYTNPATPAGTTTAPNTTATDENAPASAEPDAPVERTDANTTTAEEQQAAGAPTPNTTGQAEPTGTEENPTV